MTDTRASFPENPQAVAGGPEVGGPQAPQNWREALVLLLGSRAELIRIEAAEAARGLRRRVAIMVAMVLCLVAFWALLVAGGIAALAAATGCAWHWIALGAALLHLIAALILARISKRPPAPAFEATKAEFQKDREWLLRI